MLDYRGLGCGVTVIGLRLLDQADGSPLLLVVVSALELMRARHLKIQLTVCLASKSGNIWIHFMMLR